MGTDRGGGLGWRLALLYRARRRPLIVLAATLLVLHGWVVARSGDTAGAVAALQSGLLLGALGAGAVLSAGVVSRDVRDGTAYLWLQKPVSPIGFYLARFSDAALASALCTLALSIASGSLALGLGGGASRDVVALVPTAVVVSTVCVAAVFGLSVWCGGADVYVALVVLAFGALVENELAVRAPDGLSMFARLGRALLVPGSAIRDVSSFMAGRGDALLAPLAHISGYVAGWIVLGCLGARRLAGHLESRPR